MIFLSLFFWTNPVVLFSLVGLFTLPSVKDTPHRLIFPQGCTNTSSLRFYALLLTVYVFFHLWSWMTLKLFRCNQCNHSQDGMDIHSWSIKVSHCLSKLSALSMMASVTHGTSAASSRCTYLFSLFIILLLI